MRPAGAWRPLPITAARGLAWGAIRPCKARDWEGKGESPCPSVDRWHCSPCLALTATPALASTSAHHAAPSGTKIIVADTAFGHSLAVGSGPFKNYTLYY